MVYKNKSEVNGSFRTELFPDDSHCDGNLLLKKCCFTKVKKEGVYNLHVPQRNLN